MAARDADSAALTIQKNYKGHLAKKLYAQMKRDAYGVAGGVGVGAGTGEIGRSTFTNSGNITSY